MSDDKRWATIGLPFQLTMMVLFIVSTYLYIDAFQHLGYYKIVHLVGITLFGICLYTLYPISKERPKHLITGGIFRYTRHPMYTGLLLMAGAFWFSEKTYDLRFYVLQGALVSCLLIAAWCQEKETLARYGTEAEAYYAQTPRLFFMYPLTLLRRQ